MSGSGGALTTPLDVVTEWSPRTVRALPALPDHLQRAVMQFYLCMRGLDEIEDHVDLPADTKIRVLRGLADCFRTGAGFDAVLEPGDDLPEVSRRLGEWRAVASDEIRPRIDETMAMLADRMAFWVDRNWHIRTETDFELYVHDVAVSNFLLLDDILGWGSGQQGDRRVNVVAARALQVENMVSGRQKDLERGVDFLPDSWSEERLAAESAAGRGAVRAYVEQHEPGYVRDFLATEFVGRY